MADVANCAKNKEGKTSSVAQQLLVVLRDTTSNLVSPYITCRRELANLFSTLADASLEPTDLSLLRSKLFDASSKVDEEADTPPPPPAASVTSTTVSSSTPKPTAVKDALQTSAYWLRFVLQRSPFCRCTEEIFVSNIEYQITKLYSW